jgi:predicted ATPase
VSEPGRRIVDEALHRGAGPLPWVDLTGFLHRAWALALADRDAAAQHTGWVFFDRGLVDAAAGLAHQSGRGITQLLGAEHRYHRQVFLTPPWPAIYATDDARRHGLDEARAEYERLVAAYTALGYALTVLPLADVSTRVAQVLQTLGPRPGPV